MKQDLYTKVVLTVIALLLAVIGFKSVVPSASSGHFAGVRFTGPEAMWMLSFFDSRTGEIWVYDRGTGKVVQKLRLSELGQALTDESAK